MVEPVTSAPSIKIIRGVEPEPVSVSPPVTTERPLGDSTLPKTWTVGTLRFEFHRSTGRLNVHGEGGDGVSARLAKGTCTSEDLTIVPGETQPKRFTVREWKLIIDMTDSKFLLIELPDEDFQTRIGHNGYTQVQAL